MDANPPILPSRRRRVRAAALLVALATAGSALAAPPPERQCKKLEVSAAGGTGRAGGKPATFSASEIEDLVFSVKLPASLRGEHVVAIELTMPGGFRYEVLTAAVEIGGGRGKQRRVDGYPFPLEVQETVPVTNGPDAGRHEARLSLPVAGTAIVNNSLYGDWQAVARLDGAEEPCSDPLVFQVTQ